MSERNLEQQTKIKICVKIGKSGSELLGLLECLMMNLLKNSLHPLEGLHWTKVRIERHMCRRGYINVTISYNYIPRGSA